MAYAREFYELNLYFARKVCQVANIPYEQALINYTNLYIRFGLGPAIDQFHPTWQEYLRGLAIASDQGDWTYSFATERAGSDTPVADGRIFGCFSYSTWDDKRVRLHFHNQEPAGVSPLGCDQLERRILELRTMFTHIKSYAPGIERVVGGSWLYNLEAYRRLFPPAFVATARPGQADYQYLVLWGQFLDRDGRVRPWPARKFVECLEKQTTLEGAMECFPLKALYLEAPLRVFYEYYTID